MGTRNEELYRAAQDVIRTPSGRVLIGNILAECRIWQSGFDADTHRAAHNTGVKEAGLYIARLINSVDPHGVSDCEREWKKIANAERQRNKDHIAKERDER